MNLRPDTRPSVYINYLKNPPSDADRGTFDYLRRVRPVLTAIQPGDLPEILRNLNRRHYGKGELWTTREPAIRVATQAQRYGLIVNEVSVDDLAAYSAVLYEAEIRERQHGDIRRLKRLRIEDPETFWGEIAFMARTNIGNHPLREFIHLYSWL